MRSARLRRESKTRSRTGRLSLRLSSVALLLLCLFSLVGFFAAPFSTGPELQIRKLWTSDLPSQPPVFADSWEGELLSAHGKLALLGPEGLKTWQRTGEYYQASERYMVNYSYTDPVFPVISRENEELLPILEGYYPYVEGEWIIGLDQSRQSVLLAKSGESPLLAQPKQFASMISALKASDQFAVLGLLDGRIFVFESSEEDGVLLRPQDAWFQQGRVLDQLVYDLALQGDFLAVIYGLVQSHILIWDLSDMSLSYAGSLPGEGEGRTLLPFRGGEGFLYSTTEQAFLFLGDSDRTFSLHMEIPLSGPAVEYVNTEDPGLEFYLARDAIPQFFPQGQPGRSLVKGQPHDGAISMRDSVIYWLGSQSAGALELRWTE